jgi:hypothetical protein
MMLPERSIYGVCDDSGSGGTVLYIEDRGVSRWDTCAVEGVWEAHGGRLTKLTAYLAAGEAADDGEEERRRGTGGSGNGEFYNYLASPTNPDFVPGLAGLTRNNRRARSVKDEGRRCLSRPKTARRRRREGLEFMRIRRHQEGVEYGRGEDVHWGGDTEGRLAESPLFQLSSLPYVTMTYNRDMTPYLAWLACSILSRIYKSIISWSSSRSGHSDAKCSGNERE